jgi:hypothetical protein
MLIIMMLSITGVPQRRKEDILSEINAVTSLLRAQHAEGGAQPAVQQGCDHMFPCCVLRFGRARSE